MPLYQTVALAPFNTENFTLCEDISQWASSYPLASCQYRMQMRASATTPIVAYEWSTFNGRIQYVETNASGDILLTTNPLAGATLTVGTSVVTFVASGATGLQVDIGGSLAVTAASLLAMLAASADSQISLCVYALTGTDLTIAAKASGPSGNAIAIASTVLGAVINGQASVSGAAVGTLANGQSLLMIMAPLGDTDGFSGSYVYDCRLEYSNLDFAILFGGSIVWSQGVSRTSADATIDIANVPSAASIAYTTSINNALIFG